MRNITIKLYDEILDGAETAAIVAAVAENRKTLEEGFEMMAEESHRDYYSALQEAGAEITSAKENAKDLLEKAGRRESLGAFDRNSLEGEVVFSALYGLELKNEESGSYDHSFESSDGYRSGSYEKSYTDSFFSSISYDELTEGEKREYESLDLLSAAKLKKAAVVAEKEIQVLEENLEALQEEKAAFNAKYSAVMKPFRAALKAVREVSETLTAWSGGYDESAVKQVLSQLPEEPDNNEAAEEQQGEEMTEKTTKKAVWLMNHAATKEQRKDLAKSWGVDEVITLSEESMKKWGNISPDAETLEDDLLGVIYEILDTEADYLVIQGEATAVFGVVAEIQEYGGICLAATTRRESKETTLPDGSIKKTNVFRHVRFREYRRIYS